MPGSSGPFAAALASQGVVLLMAALVWLGSVWRRDASLVDRFWSLFILASGGAFAAQQGALPERAAWALGLASLWALRLSLFLTWRNWGQGEDARYTRMRQARGAAFTWQSLWLVFGLQAVLACVVSLPLMAAAARPAPWSPLDGAGALLAAFGIVFEAVADAQLARFKANPAQRGRVMDRGLWAWSRHPNYFGEACVWWGLGLMACATGAWWALVSPLLMTVLLLRVSGVTLLERHIVHQRPAYRDYIARTSAFWPRPPRSPGQGA